MDDIQRPYPVTFARSKCRHTDVINVNLGYDFVTDMLVLEFALDNALIDTTRQNNPWLPRAAQSLAEALRLAASKELDIEFTELVTGYRLRENAQGSFVDIYVYDSLSSGAGYAITVAEDIKILLERVRDLLQDCNCENACHKCLKHYRNQHIHGMLDRFAALDLLNWGMDGSLAKGYSVDQQVKMISSLRYILNVAGYHINTNEQNIFVEQGKQAKKLVVYPAMWAEPNDGNTIYVSDAYFKYAKPYALKKITDRL